MDMYAGGGGGVKERHGIAFLDIESLCMFFIIVSALLPQRKGDLEMSVLFIGSSF